MARSDGKGRRLIAPTLYSGPGMISSFHPMPSPDGTMLAFARQFLDSPGATRLCTRKMRPPYPRAVCRPRDGRDAFHPVWSPDGSEIAFVRRRAARWSLAVLRLGAGRVREVAELRNPRRAYPGSDTLLTHQAWSPAGGHLVFSSGGDIFVAARDGSRLRQLTRSRGVWDRAPAWSPDGRWIAWLRGGNVHVMVSDGSAKTRVTSLRAMPKRQPRWAPRRSRLALVFTAGNGVYVTQDRYHRPARVATFSSVLDYGWSPDGNALVVTTRRDARPGMWTVGADGRGRKRILTGPEFQRWVMPSWR
jgi:Tol biopolymer transport system component